MVNSQVNANVDRDSARSSTIVFTVMLGNIGDLIPTWSFLPFDAPKLHIGNGVNLATTTIVLIVSSTILAWNIRENRKRDGNNVEQQLNGLSSDGIRDLDWKHSGYRRRPQYVITPSLAAIIAILADHELIPTLQR
ncbi:major facilitator superfamily protein [Trichoderma chlorosporum]